MLLAADWVIPGAGFPVRDGAVRVRGSRIADVGDFDRLSAAYPDDPVHEYPGCTMLPGLVNAHSHLALSCMKGMLPPQPFHEWIKQMPAAVAALDADDMAASTTYGAVLAMVSGTTVVGDIAYGPEALAIAADTGLGGTFFWEVFGMPCTELARRLYDLEYPADPGRVCTDRLRCGISPHAPYTSGPDLIRATHTIAIEQHASFAVHVAESDAELELLRDGTGPFARLASRMIPHFEPPGTGAVTYLDQIGALEGTVAVHCVKVLPIELPLLARDAAGAVVCPRSNEYLHNGFAPVRRMLDAGVKVGIGTDSLASNTDLDLMNEARAVREHEPSVTPDEIVRMLTSAGAEVLGLIDDFGTLEQGKQADIVIHRLAGDDPVTQFVENASRSTVEAVVSGGVFRVLDGAPVFALSPVERASHMARQKVALAIGSDPEAYV
jgi:cytosine/adenosine deaminase-related metal-dependent hydrolase